MNDMNASEIQIRPGSIATAVLAALLLACSGPAQAAAAGRAVFVSGAPQATDAAGAARNLKRGDDVFSGDQLTTPKGARLQVSFADGAYISLQPDSAYVIEQYEFSGQQDGTERASYRLLKGGVRAITGLVGKKNPDAYKVQTPVATIGIRGTGHNTRICDGDCPGKDDGLYHNTWEGTTFVVNDVDTADVPTGSGVFVAGLDKPIEFLDQPPGVTAVDTGSTEEEEQEEEEERNTAFQVGDQRTDEGEREIIRGGTSTVLRPLGTVGIGPSEDDPEEIDVISTDDASVFVRDSDSSIVGIMLLEDEDDSSGNSAERLTLGTIDPDAVRGGDDPDAVATANSLLALADPQLIAFFQENPAHVEDQQFDGALGIFRWTGGRLLVVSEDEDSHVVELSGHQSLHFIFGPPAPPLPASGHATYDFVGGTHSTSVSGATIGNGVTGGNIMVDFVGAAAMLDMDLEHDHILYQVGGLLDIGGGSDVDISDTNVTAYSTGSSSPCYAGCQTLIDGGFAGPAIGNYPAHIGIEYDIRTQDIITGVAGFGFVSGD